jgi:hypothetical protein
VKPEVPNLSAKGFEVIKLMDTPLEAAGGAGRLQIGFAELFQQVLQLVFWSSAIHGEAPGQISDFISYHPTSALRVIFPLQFCCLACQPNG